ncbi:MAG: PilZ domain-containing protein, partial [Mariprofundaceae bacterium]|nr:PilZ domain-containing protein [Mariprofundaceae bacterium]
MSEDANNRRQDFRVDDIIPMNDTPLSTEEFEVRKNHVGIRSRQSYMLRDMVGSDIFSNDLRGKLNTDMANAMEALDTKLNYLIGVNMLNDASRSNLKERAVNFSTTGASFVSDERYRQGDPIFMTMMLPAFPPT